MARWKIACRALLLLLAAAGAFAGGDDRTHIDGIVALAMAVERAEVKPEPVELLGWL